MLSLPRLCIFLAAALAAIRGTAAGKQTHAGVHQFRTVLAAAPERWHEKVPGVNFKMPKVRHGDSLSVATDGWLDWFLVIYWGTVLMVVLAVEVSTRFAGGFSLTHIHRDDIDRRKSGKADISDDKDDTLSAEDSDSLPPDFDTRQEMLGLGKKESSFGILFGSTSKDVVGRRVDLAPNFWTLNLVAARGLAHDRAGHCLSPYLVFFAGILMGCLQVFTLFLIVYDIDPSAPPYSMIDTVKREAPWKTSALTVNCMKFVMVFFLGMSVVAEAGDAYESYIVGIGIDRKELIFPKCFVIATPMFHYLITLTVILAGVSVILSCQAVPEILYNSMAILFITQVDELFWGFFERTFDIKVAEEGWTVEMNESESPEVQLLKRCVIMFPMLWGFCLLGRAWYRNQMPALMVRVLAKG